MVVERGRSSLPIHQDLITELSLRGKLSSRETELAADSRGENSAPRKPGHWNSRVRT